MVVETDIAPPEKAKAKQPAGLVARQYLIEMLKSGGFEPGEPVRESLLAEQLRLSRNAVREALNQMVGWDIMEYVPYCGYRVRDFTLYDILEWREMREAIEPLAARRMARLRPTKVLERLKAIHDTYVNAPDVEAERGADMRFHFTIVECCGNRRFGHHQNVGILATNFMIARNLSHRFSDLPGDNTSRYLPPGFTQEEYEAKGRALTIDSHQTVLDSILRGDAEEAERESRDHAAIQVRMVEDLISHLGRGDISVRMLMQQDR